MTIINTTFVSHRKVVYLNVSLLSLFLSISFFFVKIDTSGVSFLLSVNRKIQDDSDSNGYFENEKQLLNMSAYRR